MHSQYSPPDTNNVWTTAPWSLSDDSFTESVSAKVQLDPTGIGTGLGGVIQQEIEDWHGAAPTPTDQENYEVRIVEVSSQGTDITITGDPFDVYLPLTLTRSWIATFDPQGQNLFATIVWDVSVRFVGQAEITKRVTILLIRNDAEAP